MLNRHLLVLAFALYASFTHAQDLQVQISCNVTGTSVDGRIDRSTFTEHFALQQTTVFRQGRDGQTLPWTITKGTFTSNDVQYEPTTLVLTDDYAAMAYVTESGAGFDRKLFVFTLVIDIRAMKLTRSVITLPERQPERTSAQCTKHSVSP